MPATLSEFNQSFPNSPIHSPFHPKLVLRDTLCSCEAYGMRPTKKEKDEWIFVRRQRTVGTCRSTSTNTGMVKLALPRIAAADLGRAPPTTPTVPDAAPPIPLPAHNTRNANKTARAPHCVLLKTDQHRFTQNSSCVLTRHTRSHHKVSTSLAIGTPLSGAQSPKIRRPQDTVTAILEDRQLSAPAGLTCFPCPNTLGPDGCAGGCDSTLTGRLHQSQAVHREREGLPLSRIECAGARNR
jgi:hypothetical protein